MYGCRRRLFVEFNDDARRVADAQTVTKRRVVVVGTSARREIADQLVEAIGPRTFAPERRPPVCH